MNYIIKGLQEAASQVRRIATSLKKSNYYKDIEKHISK